MSAMSRRRSPLATAVLALVCESPMHAYRMRQLIKERHQDDVVNVAQRNSVYQAIDRLVRDGLLAVRETTREENRPERIVYEATQAGRETLRQWMRTMLSTPAREFPEFPAALAFLSVLTPQEALAALRQRIATLEERLSALDAEISGSLAYVARLFLVESEYQRAQIATELDFVRGLADDLSEGRLTWDFEI
ncbi:MAG: PadR family transcriptional regulator [Microbispora sp.]|nr:PadR family transcriptional regulator [Microbispora sp.]